MNRQRLIALHLYLASFFAPFVVLVAISGGLYLVGIKGSLAMTPVYTTAKPLDAKSTSLKSDVEALLKEAGVTDYSFEYVKVKGQELHTRPTSTEHYIIKLKANKTTVTKASPNFVKSIVELHKGHGPLLFKTAQRVFAAALLIVVLSGLVLGLLSPPLRRVTTVCAAAGTVIFLLLLV